MNIVLTGGAGYIGSHAAITFSQAGHKVIIYDNFCNSDQSVLSRMEAILGHSLVCIEGDVHDTELLIDTFKQHQIEAVIHFAGFKAVGESVQDPLKYYVNNVSGSISLFQAMIASGIKKIVFSSSATVYGDPEYLPIDETHVVKPTNPYGQSKAQIEQVLKDLVLSDPEWRVVCLRYFNPAGAHESGLIGEESSGVPNNLMPYLASVATGRLKQLKVLGCDYPTADGTGIRDYVHVMDLSAGHLAALKYLDDIGGWVAINLGTGIGYSVLDLLRAYEQVANQTIDFVFSPRRNGDLASIYANVDRARSLLSWSATRDLKNMCATSWNRELKKR